MSQDKEEPNLETWVEPAIEARIIAMILGDASDFEAADLENLMDEQPELRVFHRRMKAVHELVAESETRKPSKEWRLSPERRKAVLEKIRGTRIGAPVEEKPRKARPRRAKIWIWSLSSAAAVLAVLMANLAQVNMMHSEAKADGELSNHESSSITLTDDSKSSLGRKAFFRNQSDSKPSKPIPAFLAASPAPPTPPSVLEAEVSKGFAPEFGVSFGVNGGLGGGGAGLVAGKDVAVTTGPALAENFESRFSGELGEGSDESGEGSRIVSTGYTGTLDAGVSPLSSFDRNAVTLYGASVAGELTGTQTNTNWDIAADRFGRVAAEGGLTRGLDREFIYPTEYDPPEIPRESPAGDASDFASVDFGATAEGAPIVERYFSGGANSLRGFANSEAGGSGSGVSDGLSTRGRALYDDFSIRAESDSLRALNRKGERSAFSADAAVPVTGGVAVPGDLEIAARMKDVSDLTAATEDPFGQPALGNDGKKEPGAEHLLTRAQPGMVTRTPAANGPAEGSAGARNKTLAFGRNGDWKWSSNDTGQGIAPAQTTTIAGIANQESAPLVAAVLPEAKPEPIPAAGEPISESLEKARAVVTRLALPTLQSPAKAGGQVTAEAILGDVPTTPSVGAEFGWDSKPASKELSRNPGDPATTSLFSSLLPDAKVQREAESEEEGVTAPLGFFSDAARGTQVPTGKIAIDQTREQALDESDARLHFDFLDTGEKAKSLSLANDVAGGASADDIAVIRLETIAAPAWGAEADKPEAAGENPVTITEHHYKRAVVDPLARDGDAAGWATFRAPTALDQKGEPKLALAYELREDLEEEYQQDETWSEGRLRKAVKKPASPREEESQQLLGLQQEQQEQKLASASTIRSKSAAKPAVAPRKSKSKSKPKRPAVSAKPAPKPAPMPVPVLQHETATADEPFSTFSLHVSDVSFKLAMAALLEKGEWPEAQKIRVEEFVNAFDYGDPPASLKEKVACRLEQSAHPFLAQRNLLRVSMRTAAIGRAGSKPLRLTVLLDKSGSMERADREESVLRAMHALASHLTANDSVTVIAFARQPRLIADRLSGDKASELVGLVARTPSEGGTNLEEALRLGEEMAKRQFAENGMNRIVLLTDGAANLGNARPESLMETVIGLRRQGIAFDACGVGADGLNDAILEALTRQGDGRYYFLNRPQDADSGFVRQLAGALRPAARNVKVQVRFNPERVPNYRLLGFEKHRLKKEDFRNDKVDAAEMAAAEAGVALYQIEVDPSGSGEVGEVFVRFQDMTSGRMVERSWPIPYQTRAPAFDHASASLRLAGTAAFLAEKLRGGPAGDAVQLADLAGVTSALRSDYRSDTRVLKLLEMVEKARNLDVNR